MADEYPFWNVGSAYRVQLQSGADELATLVDRDKLGDLSPKLESLLSGGFTITGSSDWPALLIYPQAMWSDLSPKLEQLPSMNRAAREIQRKMLGMARSFGETDHLELSAEQKSHAEICQEVVIIEFPSGWAEIWGGECLDRKASEWVESC